jgi:hypothetical protein
MSLGEDQEEFAVAIGKLIVWAYSQGYRIRLGDTYPGKFKHSVFGQHPKGLAIDLNLFRDGRYLTLTEDHAPLGHFYESLSPHATWGGHWNDGNHYSWKERGRKQ